MPLYKVSVTLETVVYADDADDARSIARDGLEAAMDEEYRDVEVIESLADLPPEWTAETLVWHEGSEDMSVKDALAKKGDG